MEESAYCFMLNDLAEESERHSAYSLLWTLNPDKDPVSTFPLPRG